MKEKKNSQKYIQSVERALSILSFVGEKGEARLNEISKHSGLNPTTAFGLLRTLEHTGYLVRCNQGMGYCLGLNCLRLGLCYGKNSGMYDYIHKLLTELVAAVNETAYFSLKIGNQYSKYDIVLSSQRLKVVPSDDRFVSLPDQSAVATIFREYPSGLAYAVDIEGVTPGLNCFAAPYLSGGNMAGCVAVVGPSNRFTAENMEKTYQIYCDIVKKLDLNEFQTEQTKRGKSC